MRQAEENASGRTAAGVPAVQTGAGSTQSTRRLGPAAASMDVSVFVSVLAPSRTHISATAAERAGKEIPRDH